ncbi:MAG: DUF2218 domain-containing protein [Roseovarius sp.]
MPTLIGRIETEHGAKYLTQLCKHFAHKIDATWDGNHGRADFVFGPAIMEADPQGLTIRFDVDKDKNVPAAKGVIDSHLVTFAHREKIEGMEWTAA